MDEDRARRLALNEAIARDVNNAVGEIAADWHADHERISLICECSLESCSERIHVTLPEYGEVRRHPNRFLVVDEHVVEQIEQRVGSAGDATVVEKIGPGRDVAEATA
jgi:hypothetical protein